MKKKQNGFIHSLATGEDILSERYCQPNVLTQAQQLLQEDELSEEMFLGAQGVLMINGLL